MMIILIIQTTLLYKFTYYSKNIKMLGFTHNSRTKSSNRYSLQFQQQYSPIVITNAGSGKQLPMAEPIYPKKNLLRTVNNKVKRKSVQRKQKPIKPKNDFVQIQSKNWNSQTNQKVGLFDNNLRKDSLAAAQRQIRAQSRKKQNTKFKQKQLILRNDKIIKKQDQIHKKKLNMVSSQQQKQIQQLRQLIQKQREQKQKNDLIYQQKKRRIQQQRKQLIQIERKIQQQAPLKVNQIKMINRQIKAPNTVNTQIKPQSDKIRKTQNSNYQAANRQKNIENNQKYGQITQSQFMANQKNKIRQQQLEYLVDQRERHHKQYQRNTLGYTPTLVPLLSRASYKIISTHISTLVQILVDDLLQEQVYLLEAIELEAKAEVQKNKQKQVIKDYVYKLQNFVDQVQQIEYKLGKYTPLKLHQLPKPSIKSQQYNKSSIHGFSYDTSQFKALKLPLTSEQVKQIEQRIDRFKRYVSSFDEYKMANMKMFEAVTEEIIDQAVERLAKELDNGAGEFVNIVFRSQFQ